MEDDQKARELTGFVTYRISQLHPKLNAQAAHVLKQHAGLSLVQWRILALIEAFGPAVSSGTIIEKASMDKGLFSRGLKRLMADSFVVGEVDKEDQRRVPLSLTPRGRELHDKTIAIMRRRQEHLLHDLTDEERDCLFSALEKLMNNAGRKSF